MDRRAFLKKSTCGAMSSLPILSTLLNLKVANQAAAASLEPGQDCKTIVCVFLGGGNDAFNTMVPIDAQHAEYSVSRSNLALAINDLLPLNQLPNGDGRRLRIPPKLQRYAGTLQRLSRRHQQTAPGRGCQYRNAARTDDQGELLKRDGFTSQSIVLTQRPATTVADLGAAGDE